MGHLHWGCVCFLVHVCLADCVFGGSGLWCKAELYILPALLALPFINILSAVLPFSTLASRCMSGNHTRHWGGGSDINVSRKVLRETFFCAQSAQRRGEIRQEKSSTASTLKQSLIHLYYTLWLMNPHLLCKARSCSLFSVTKRRSLKHRHG